MKNQCITIFEHQILKVGTNGFTQKHLDSLTKWLFKNKTAEDNSQFFSLVDHGVKFKSWVGILQIGSVYIEVLPKISNQNNSDEVIDEWRNRLCKMLSFTKSLNIRQTGNINQDTVNHPLWEIFYRCYLSLIQDLIKTGLIKTYKCEQANKTALKGRLLFQKQLTKNVVHQEFFYTESPVYNRDSLINQVIFKALRVISNYPPIVHDAKLLLECFNDIKDISPEKIDWKKINMFKKERKTEKYQDALNFAELIIRGTNPNLNLGLYNVTGIMFDMNALFEKYVAQKMSQYLPGKITVQSSDQIWESRRARPDIIYKKSNTGNIIFDTKWKKISITNDVSIEDIFQQYVYCKKFNAEKAFLIYPWWSGKECGEIFYEDNISELIIQNFSTKNYKIKNDDTSLGILFWKWK